MWKDLWSKWNGECPLLKQGGSSEPDESSCSCFWKFVNFLFDLNLRKLFAIFGYHLETRDVDCLYLDSPSCPEAQRLKEKLILLVLKVEIGFSLGPVWPIFGHFTISNSVFGIFKSKWLFLALFHALFLNPFFGRGQGGQMGQSDGREQREWSRQLQWFLYKNHPPFPWVKKITIAIVYDLPPKIWNTSHRQYFSIWLNIFLQDNWKICLFYDNNILKCGVLS